MQPRRLTPWRLLGALVLGAVIAGSGCGEVDAPTATENLNPPLGLVLSKLSGNAGKQDVQLEWWGSNYEQNFDGYIVLMNNKANVRLEDDKTTTVPNPATRSGATLALKDFTRDRNSPLSFTLPNALIVERFGIGTGLDIYLIVKSHSSTGKVSDSSNEIKVTL